MTILYVKKRGDIHYSASSNSLNYRRSCWAIQTSTYLIIIHYERTREILLLLMVVDIEKFIMIT
ncbi:hypothetical protein JHK86_006295 [Glycine max]|nr:hypothetical protein JHK86_006295 [Glycine max]